VTGTVPGSRAVLSYLKIFLAERAVVRPVKGRRSRCLSTTCPRVSPPRSKLVRALSLTIVKVHRLYKYVKMKFWGIVDP
jgi:hypothetical protein